MDDDDPEKNLYIKEIKEIYIKKIKIRLFISKLETHPERVNYLAKHSLPITIVLLNNRSSGMIRSRQKWRYNNKFLHTTPESGYSVPNFDIVVKSYGIKFYKINMLNVSKIKKIIFSIEQPKMLEINIDPKIEMIPHLPIGFPIQKLLPALDEKKYNWLENL